jgi:hypothetical protein
MKIHNRKLRTGVHFFRTGLLPIGQSLINRMDHPTHGYISMKDYLIAFPDNLAALAKLKITPTELQVILYILKAMEWGNLIGFQQKAACAALEMKKSNMSTIFKNLERKGVITRSEAGHLYINSNLFAKGLGREMYSTTRQRLRSAAREINGIVSAFDDEPATPAPAPAPPAVAASSTARMAGYRPQAQRPTGGAARRSALWARPDGRVRMPL